VPATPFPDLGTEYAIRWKQIDPKALLYVKPTIEDALMLARDIAVEKEGLDVLVTGSLHLVGGALSLLRP
jgi:folylpolyglutamate synthase